MRTRNLDLLSRWTPLILALACLTMPAAAQVWIPEGPAPIENSQSLTGNSIPGTGAVQAIAPHPTNPDILYAAAVNGGIWRTDNATAPNVHWVAQTPYKASGSMSVLDLDPLDPTGQTAIAGHGRTSSFGSTGLGQDGVLYTTDGGANWNYVNGPGNIFQDLFISGVEARGNVLLVSVTGNDCARVGAYRSTDSGATWTRLTQTANGMPIGSNEVMEGDPTDPAVLYSAVNAHGSVCDNGLNGVYKSTDTGASWSRISDATMEAIIDTANSSGTDIRISASQATPRTRDCSCRSIPGASPPTAASSILPTGGPVGRPSTARPPCLTAPSAPVPSILP